MITIVKNGDIMTANIAATFMDGDAEMMLVKVASKVSDAKPAKATMKAPTFKAKKPVPRIVAKEVIEAADNAPAVVPATPKKTWSRKAKPVVCLNTEMVFKSSMEAAN